MKKAVGNRRRVGALAVLAGAGLALSAGVAVSNTSSDSGQTLTPLSAGESDRYQASTPGPDGTTYHVGYVDSPSTVDRVIALTRTTADGRLDTSFGNGGVVTKNLRSGPFVAGAVGGAPTGTAEAARAVVVQSDGKVIVVGQAETPADPAKPNWTDIDIYAVRFTDTGAIDTTYGTDGVARVDLSDGVQATGTTVRGDQAYGAALRPDGRLVIFGSKGTDSSDNAVRVNSQLAIVSLTTAGQRDTAFGDNGVASGGPADISPNPRNGVIEPDGKITMSGYGGSPTRPILLRVLSDGTPDATFGTAGVANVTLPPTAARAEAYGLVPQNGKYVLAAYGSRAESSSDTDAILYRINGDGTWDTTFGQPGQSGFVTFDGGVGGGADRFRNVAGLPDGRIVAIGGVTTSTTPTAVTSGLVAVYKPDGTLDPSVGDNGIFKVKFGGPGDFLYGIAVNGTKVTVSGYLGGSTPKADDAAIAWLDLAPRTETPIVTPPAPQPPAPQPPAPQPPAPAPVVKKARTAGKVTVTCTRIGAKKTLVRCTVKQANIGKGAAQVILARKGTKTVSAGAKVSAKGTTVVTFRTARKAGAYTVALRLPTPAGNRQAISRKITLR